ncbi:hypothetical protein EV360DRAFT_84446 [Lentinula raphanica]|nr:hypothetical protein EV360DRAFT_84446 [Lentinula raphanica]
MTGSITIDPECKPVHSGARIGTLTVHSEKSQDIVTGMWEEIDKATFASQFDFLQTTKRKLRQKGKELKREDPRLGWVQSDSEKQQMNMLFGKVKPLGEKSKGKDTGEDETGRDVLMAPPFIPGIPPGTSSGASGYADTPAGYAYTPAEYTHTPAPAEYPHTPAGYAHTSSGYTHTPAPGYAAAGSGYAHTPAAFGYATAPGYIPTSESVPPGSSAVNLPPLSESFPEPGVEKLPVYFVAVKSDGKPLERTYYGP